MTSGPIGDSFCQRSIFGCLTNAIVSVHNWARPNFIVPKAAQLLCMTKLQRSIENAECRLIRLKVDWVKSHQ